MPPLNTSYIVLSPLSLLFPEISHVSVIHVWETLVSPASELLKPPCRNTSPTLQDNYRNQYIPANKPTVKTCSTDADKINNTATIQVHFGPFTEKYVPRTKLEWLSPFWLLRDT